MFWFVAAALVLLLGTTTPAGSEPTLDPQASFRVTTLPSRPAGAITGSAFAQRTTGWAGRNRQRAALEELEGGNIPDFLRTLVPLQLSYLPPNAAEVRATVWVMPDYLAIGSDQDFLYIPLVRERATRIARQFGFVLPTPKIVDAIHEQAVVRLDPVPLPPGPKMRSSVYYLRHQALIDEQRREVPPGTLISGHKKDLVITNRLRGRPDRIAIYGWHHPNGEPIQPLSTVHGARYADYSHGVRLVWGTMLVDGEPRSLQEVLANPSLAPLLTYEGTIPGAARLMDPEVPAGHGTES